MTLDGSWTRPAETGLWTGCPRWRKLSGTCGAPTLKQLIVHIVSVKKMQFAVPPLSRDRGLSVC
jgi:hypothetical protein